ncbi:uncharacterized protein MONOS_9693 [Monocercomonoides exilis]|uniref:uncharacterized protein n=1 Tax=Monocercomonoides exilis TaxID=2049356 RepID=UPI0035595136|nr:hypothetical protein MONOS_9693 [Monocercomonoides exilis]|eukprot:MONOS_9693.1-p1 / transcript=MONOS_9693.1 / gene=MONOS_9693 / organism=Monocercomonoides_exilis_PA203 / gene_product=unspecified product / transcript_product=unspecified product / location=Mono_scaffold00410:16606-17728(+) / protein_length=291 / sequence_SO=supercontig / SO=protein_coding / is_pseudo=false
MMKIHTLEGKRMWNAHHSPSIKESPSKYTLNSTKIKEKRFKKMKQSVHLRNEKPKRKQPDFDELQDRKTKQLEKIEKTDVNQDEEKKDESLGFITDHFLHFTNDEHLRLPKTTIVELGNLIKSIVNSAPKKGPPSTLSPHDKLIVYLKWLSSRTTLERISSLMGISQSMASNCLTDACPALLSALNEIFSTPPRPPTIPNEEFPNVALLVDATTIKVPYPISTTFTEGKKLFDAHHSVYCIKIEVAVSSWKPHKALFVSDAIEGGKHDVFLFRKKMKRYEEYKKKLMKKE